MQLGQAMVTAIVIGFLVTLFFGGGLLEGAWGWPRWLSAPTASLASLGAGHFFAGRKPKRSYICFFSLGTSIFVFATAP